MNYRDKTLIRGESLYLKVVLYCENSATGKLEKYDATELTNILNSTKNNELPLMVAEARLSDGKRIPLTIIQELDDGVALDGALSLYSDVDTWNFPGESFDVNIVLKQQLDLGFKDDNDEIVLKDVKTATFNETFYIARSATDLREEPQEECLCNKGIGGHSVVYLLDGQFYACENHAEGDTITPMETPTREGYTFSGWSEIPETMPDHCVVVSGTLSVSAEYKTITYYIDDVLWQTQQVEVGTEITPLIPDEREDYHFGGWVYLPRLMPNEDIVATGSWYGIVSTGYFGENDTAPYKIFADGYMVVYGTGYIEKSLSWNNYQYFGIVRNIEIKNGIEGIRSLGNTAPMAGCAIKSIIIPDSCSVIGQRAFAGIVYIGSLSEHGENYDPTPYLDIVIPNTVTEIGLEAFSGSNMIKNVTFGNRVRTIGNSVFNSDMGIKSIVIPDNVVSLGQEVYRYIMNLEEITFGAGLTSIGYSYFDRNNLEKIVFRCSYNQVTMDIQWNPNHFDNPDIPMLDVYYKNDGSWDSYIANAPSRLNWIPIEV